MKKKLKIAIVIDGLGYGGIERVGIDFASLLKELGHDVDIYNLNPKYTDLESQIDNDIRVYHNNFPRWFSPEFCSNGTDKWWWGKYAYAIIHILMTVFLLIYRPFGRVRKRKYDIAIAFAGHMNDLTFIDKKFINYKHRICWLHGSLAGFYIINAGFLALYKKFQNIVVLSDEGQDFIFMQKKNLNLNITKMYCPITVTDFKINDIKVQELHESYGKFVLVVARLSYPHKDHYTVIKAMKLLHDKYHKDTKVVFVGDGPEREKLKDYCEKQNMVDNVIFAGKVDEVQSYYSACYISVLSSIAGEGLPSVLFEAMSLGKPVVTTDCKYGPREICGDNEFGLLCKVRDSEGMAKQLDKLLSDEKVYKYYQEQGLKRAMDVRPEVIKIQLDKLIDTINES